MIRTMIKLRRPSSRPIKDGFPAPVSLIVAHYDGVIGVVIIRAYAIAVMADTTITCHDSGGGQWQEHYLWEAVMMGVLRSNPIIRDGRSGIVLCERFSGRLITGERKRVPNVSAPNANPQSCR